MAYPCRVMAPGATGARQDERLAPVTAKPQLYVCGGGVRPQSPLVGPPRLCQRGRNDKRHLGGRAR